MNKTALLAGASGLVGSQLIELLLESPEYTRVVVIVRKTTGIRHRKLEEYIVNFNNLESHSHVLKADDVFCCLGTTMKNAGSKEAFYRVDYTYVLKLAEITFKNGATQFLVISALGASPTSSIYYSRVKGEMEAAVKKIPFRSVKIFRPSFLTGDRKENRTGEKFGILLARIIGPFMFGPLKKYKAVADIIVARAMLRAASEAEEGNLVFESDKILEKGKSWNP